VLDFVPFAGALWEVADDDLQPGLGGELRQLELPQPRPVAVRPPAILATTIDLGAVTSWTAWGRSGEESSVIRAFFQDCASVIRFGVTSASFAETGK